MAKQASKTAIGGFVISAMALLIIGVIVFGGEKYFKKRIKYVLFFEGAVNGLNVGAPVVFRGVKIGSVESVVLRADAETMAMAIPVVIGVDPDQVEVKGKKAKQYRHRLNELIENGLKPIILERGKKVSERKVDIALISREHKVNADSNYCFGEGGAGTFSDGKLYTRSKKRGDNNKVLNLFQYHGAPDSILYDAHPHIGTDKLPGIISGIRKISF